MSTHSLETAEGLRMLLLDLAYAGPRAWTEEPVAAELMTYTMEKYGALAHKYGLEPSDAAIAAFEVMRTRAVRVADDPWAVVTRAVQLSLIYESRAEGLLCSTQQARKTSGADLHDAERFSDRESEILEYHPAFHVEDDLSAIDEAKSDEIADEPTNAYAALDLAVGLFVESGWHARTARLCLEYIAARLIRTGSRHSAFESLRRDRHGPAMLDIDHESWLAVLRVALGNQHPDRALTAAGHGVLLRLLIGERQDELYRDLDLVETIESVAPAVKDPGPSHV